MLQARAASKRKIAQTHWDVVKKNCVEDPTAAFKADGGGAREEGGEFEGSMRVRAGSGGWQLL